MSAVFIQPQRQQVWFTPPVVNFACGGAGAGLYFWSLATPGGGGFVALIRCASVALVAFGLAVLALEAGHPLRARFLLGNLRSSWMSRESLAAAVFVPAGLASAWWPRPPVVGVAALAALAFVVSQGFIVFRSRAIPAWNCAAIPPLFLASSLASGAGAWLVIAAAAPQAHRASPALLAMIAASLAADAGGWLCYVFGRRGDEAFRSATAALRRPRSLVMIVGLGRALPLLVLAGAWLAGSAPASLRAAALLAGAATCGATWLQKKGIVRDCADLRSVTIPLGEAGPQAGGRAPAADAGLVSRAAGD